MPLAESLGEFVFKAMAVNQVDIGGGQVRLTVDFTGEVKGLVPGTHFGTLTVNVIAPPGRPNPWTYVGTTLTTSGGVVRVTGQGIQMRTGEGHKNRFRGTASYATDDPKLAEINGLIAAVEAESDPLTLTLKGAACVWK
jgi:hypothetical protein